MTNVPRSKITASIWIFGSFFLITAAVYLWLLGEEPASNVAGNLTTQPSGPPHFSFDIQSPPVAWVFVLALLGSICTVLFYEVVASVVRWLWWGVSPKRKLINFFGDDAVEQTEKAMFVVPLGMSKSRPAESGKPPRRDQKAKRWINACDSASARYVLRELINCGLKVPMPTHLGGDDQLDLQDAPFDMHFGLGYTASTRQIIEHHCGDWIQVRVHSQYGDVVWLRESLCKPLEQALTTAEIKREEFPDGLPPNVDPTQFRMILPKAWDASAYERWKDAQSVNDYAIVLRYTDSERKSGRRSTQFVLAGFTEQGTEAAGAFLASHWETLNFTLCKAAKKPSAGYGDFCMFVVGMTGDLTNWRAVNGGVVSASHLLAADIKDCHWVQRSG